MASRSVVLEAREITLAIELIELGARLQVLEAEVGLSRERLIKLYKEVRGVSPPKGMLPFSTDWFMTWQPNIHSSLFYNTYRFMINEAKCTPIQATIRAYRLYLEHIGLQGGEAVLGLTRAWTLLRFFDSKMLQSAPCSRCGAHFVTHANEPTHGMVCGLCQPPSRAGKTRAQRVLADELAAEGAYAVSQVDLLVNTVAQIELPELLVSAEAPATVEGRGIDGAADHADHADAVDIHAIWMRSAPTSLDQAMSPA